MPFDPEKTTGTPQEWMEHFSLDEASIVGIKVWYSTAVFNVPPTNVDDLPEQDVQMVSVYVYKDGKVRLQMLDGVDEYWLPGASKPIYGKELPWEEFNQLGDIAFRTEWSG